MYELQEEFYKVTKPLVLYYTLDLLREKCTLDECANGLVAYFLEKAPKKAKYWLSKVYANLPDAFLYDLKKVAKIILVTSLLLFVAKLKQEGYCHALVCSRSKRLQRFTRHRQTSKGRRKRHKFYNAYKRRKYHNRHT